MEGLENRLGYRFTDGSLLEHALTHSSYANEDRARSRGSNERLEFLGDSVLGLVAAERIYARYPDMPEGKMTRLRAELVCEASLKRVADELGLGDYILLGKGEEQTGGRRRSSILADCVEAVIAAIYLDGGIEPARRFIEERILADMQTTRRMGSSDHKTMLQELVQSKSGQSLVYEMTGESGPDHDKQFTFRVLLNGVPVGEGSGRSKKEAEQAAAGAALRELDQ